MSQEQLEGQLSRLERELASAFGMQPWPQALIERLTDDIFSIECQLRSGSGC